jgi:hypothetical protein
MNNLQELNLNSNPIREVHGQSFFYLNSLRVLYLKTRNGSSMHINVYNDTFSGLGSIKHIKIQYDFVSNFQYVKNFRNNKDSTIFKLTTMKLDFINR